MECNITADVVCEKLRNLLMTYKSQMMKIAEDSGLTMPQLHALHTISEGNASMGAVARVLQCDASNVTGIIDRLKALSLVTREEDPEDRRVKTVLLTDKGKEVIARVMHEMPDRLGCNRLSQDELLAFATTIDKLTNN